MAALGEPPSPPEFSEICPSSNGRISEYLEAAFRLAPKNGIEGGQFDNQRGIV